PKLLFVLAFRQRPGDAAAVRAALGALLRVKTVLRDDVADRYAAAGRDDPGELTEDGGLVGGEVDHAVRDRHVDTLRGQGDLLDHSLQEVGVGDARVGDVAP